MPCMDLMDEGIEKCNIDWIKSGIGITTSGEVKFGYIEDGSDWRDFIAAYPVLVENGAAATITYAKEVDGRQPRSLLGYNDQYVFIVAVDGRRTGKPGMTFAQCQTLMIKFGCTYAINLDGGGSTRLLYKGSVVNSPTENRPVDNVVCAYLRKTNTSVPVSNTTPISNNTTTGDYIYTVKRGDSFWAIAADTMGNGMRYATLAQYNGLSTRANLVVGQTLKIPATYLVAKYKGSTTTTNTNPVQQPTTSAPSTTYVVKRGDSLWAIAQKFYKDGSQYKRIVSYKNMSRAAIYDGQVLKIPL